VGAVQVAHVLDEHADGLHLAAELAEDLKSLLGQAKLDGLGWGSGWGVT
jgi:hypothetical protein